MSNKKSNGYYDLDIDVCTLVQDNGMVQDYFYLNDLKQRKLFLYDQIDQGVVGELTRHIMQYNRADNEAGTPVEEREPIKLYIACRGGEVEPGFQLIDIVQASTTPVYTINIGYAYSMAFLVLLSGTKRFAAASATYLLHDGSFGAWDSGAKVQDRFAFNKRLDDKIREFVLNNSNLSAEEYDSKFRVEWYMFNDEAKEKGFVDYIIGEDCDLADVI